MATTVILVRHADKDIPQVEDNPSLNRRGMARARELARVLSTAGVQAIYTSEAKRAKMTAKAFFQSQLELSNTLALVRLQNAPELREHILANHEGQTVLVVGHAGTVPAFITEFGGPSLTDIPEMISELVPTRNELNDCVFDNLFVLVRQSATETSLRSGLRVLSADKRRREEMDEVVVDVDGVLDLRFAERLAAELAVKGTFFRRRADFFRDAEG